MSDVKNNYKFKYKNDLNCSLCKKQTIENETHLLNCEVILSECGKLENIQYEDVFKNIEKQIKAVKIWRKIFQIKTWKTENSHLSSGHQVHQMSASFDSNLLLYNLRLNNRLSNYINQD